MNPETREIGIEGCPRELRRRDPGQGGGGVLHPRRRLNIWRVAASSGDRSSPLQTSSARHLCAHSSKHVTCVAWQTYSLPAPCPTTRRPSPRSTPLRCPASRRASRLPSLPRSTTMATRRPPSRPMPRSSRPSPRRPSSPSSTRRCFENLPYFCSYFSAGCWNAPSTSR